MNRAMVVKEMTFDSAHYLPGYNGPCANMHGHTYKLQVAVAGPINLADGMVIDFKDLTSHMLMVKSLMDHKVLNEVTDDGFPNHMPTAENMAQWIWNRLDRDLQTFGVQLVFVKLWETPTSFVAVGGAV